MFREWWTIWTIYCIPVPYCIWGRILFRREIRFTLNGPKTDRILITAPWCSMRPQNTTSMDTIPPNLAMYGTPVPGNKKIAGNELDLKEKFPSKFPANDIRKRSLPTQKKGTQAAKNSEYPSQKAEKSKMHATFLGPSPLPGLRSGWMGRRRLASQLTLVASAELPRHHQFTSPRKNITDRYSRLQVQRTSRWGSVWKKKKNI
jgi:hypothetical protein